MKFTEWGKAVLSIYHNLESVCNTLDELVLKKGIKSRNVGFDTEGTLKLMDGMLDLTERKIKFINLKLIVEKAIKAMDDKDSKYLVFRYFDRYSFGTIAHLVGASLRTAQRRVTAATVKFNQTLIGLGFNRNYLQSRYGNEPFIQGVFERFNSDKRNKGAKTTSKITSDELFINNSIQTCNYIRA